MDRKEELKIKMTELALKGHKAAGSGDMALSNELFRQMKPLMLEYGQLTNNPEYAALVKQGDEAHKEFLN